MNRLCNYNTTTNISSNASCILSCEGNSHDVSNLLYSANRVLPSSCPSLKLGIRRSSSSERISRGPLYPCAKAIATEETAPSCWQEWISGGTTDDSSQDDQWKVTSHYPQHHYQQQEKQPLPPVNYEKQQATYTDLNLAAEEEPEEGEHPLLQIAPGIRVPYIGTAERTRALIKSSVKEPRTTVQAECFSCQVSLVCMAGMKYVACIACHTVSPLPEDVTHVRQQNGAGIGLLREEAEILRRRAHC